MGSTILQPTGWLLVPSEHLPLSPLLRLQHWMVVWSLAHPDQDSGSLMGGTEQVFREPVTLVLLPGLLPVSELFRREDPGSRNKSRSVVQAFK